MSDIDKPLQPVCHLCGANWEAGQVSKRCVGCGIEKARRRLVAAGPQKQRKGHPVPPAPRLLRPRKRV